MDLAEGNEVHVDGRGVRHDILCIACRIGHCRLQRIRDLAELFVDLAHVVCQLPCRAGERAVEAAQLPGNAADGGVEVSKIGRSDNLCVAGEKPAGIQIASDVDTDRRIVDRNARAHTGAVVNRNRTGLDRNIKS